MTPVYPEFLMASDVAQILADQPGNRKLENDASYLKDHWITSTVFQLVPIRCSFVGVSKKKPADHSTSNDPIIVELNINQVGREVYSDEGGHGQVPDLLVIDGQHRWYEAQDDGRLTMDAYVGDVALSIIQQKWNQFAQQVGPPLRSFFEDEFPGGALAALRHLLPTDQIDALRKARKIYKETKKLPHHIRRDYPFIIES